jgi:hypothetical protein
MRDLKSSPVTVITNHFPGNEFRDGMSVAKFIWPEGERTGTYTIALDGFVSITLDDSFPVKPYSVTLFDEGGDASVNLIKTAFGEEFADTLSSTKRLGMAAMGDFRLSEENRHTIAYLQAYSPSTPEHLLESATGMVLQHSQNKPAPIIIPRTRGDQPARNSARRKKTA